MSTSIYEQFSYFVKDIDDPRQPVKRIYPLDELLFLQLCALMAGCTGWQETVMFGEERLEALREYFPYEQGIPSAMTQLRLMSSLDPDGFESFFNSWFNRFSESLETSVISIDGKTIRGSKRGGKDPLHILHACDSNSGLLLGYKKVGNKTNEIPVGPQLIEDLHIEGCTVTLDAMGCQRKTCETIVSKGGDYLIGLKANQGSLHEDVKLLFSEMEELDVQKHISVDKGHGRIEERRIFATNDVGYLIEEHQWPHLKTVIMCQNRRLDKKKSKKETLYYITSLEPDAPNLQKKIRQHWAVEAMHWVLDVSFNEDSIPISVDNAAENLAALRRIAMNILKMYKKNDKKNRSIPQLQKICLMRNTFIQEILQTCATLK